MSWGTIKVLNGLTKGITIVDLESKTDEELMFVLRQGDHRGLEELVRRFNKSLYRFVIRMLPDADFAQDIVQESFLRVFRYREKYQPRSKFSTFLYRIAINLTMNELKRRRIHAKLIFNGQNNDKDTSVQGLRKIIYSNEESTLDKIVHDESLSLLHSALAEISPKLKTPLVLHVYEELDYPEIARILGVPVGTVKSRINRAKTRLREWMENNELL